MTRQWIVGITHEAKDLGRFFAPEDLAQLHAAATVRVLGKCKESSFRSQLAELDVLLGSWGMPRLDADFLAAAPRLQAVCYAAGTVKGFVTDESYARGIQITTAMHANAIPVAEVTVALIILANKNWFTCQDRIRREGVEGRNACFQDHHRGNYGATVGLVGFGAIGREVCARLQHYHLQVLVADPYAQAEVVAAAGARLVSLEALAASSDVVSLHAPNIPQTRHMMNRDVFARMRDGATFINTARGALVDEDALLAELQSGRIQAMLDVTDPEPVPAGHPFYSLPNCWLTPHRAGSSADEIRRMGHYAIAEVLRLIRGEALLYPVNQDMLATMA